VGRLWHTIELKFTLLQGILTIKILILLADSFLAVGGDENDYGGKDLRRRG
jgi:hypothetical protein